MEVNIEKTLLMCKSFMKEVKIWGCLKQTGVSLRYMMEFGSNPTQKNLLISAQFLHKELPIRIARRAIELHTLPHGLSHRPPVLKVPLLHCWFCYSGYSVLSLGFKKACFGYF